jgi:hypothetical protein
MQDVIVEGRTAASAQRIWAIWADVAGSPAWDTDVVWSRLDGPFAVGGRGRFKLKGGPEVGFVLDQVVRERAYANVARLLPGVTVRFTHDLWPRDGALVVRHGAEIGGPLGRLLRPLLRRVLKGALQKALDNMLRLAEETSVQPLANARSLA